jgi:hypothetical protein
MNGIPIALVDTQSGSSSIGYVTADQLGSPRAVDRTYRGLRRVTLGRLPGIGFHRDLLGGPAVQPEQSLRLRTRDPSMVGQQPIR